MNRRKREREQERHHGHFLRIQLKISPKFYGLTVFFYTVSITRHDHFTISYFTLRILQMKKITGYFFFLLNETHRTITKINEKLPEYNNICVHTFALALALVLLLLLWHIHTCTSILLDYFNLLLFRSCNWFIIFFLIFKLKWCRMHDSLTEKSREQKIPKYKLNWWWWFFGCTYPQYSWKQHNTTTLLRRIKNTHICIHSLTHSLTMIITIILQINK